MIVVTGANGRLGRAVVEGLLTRMPASGIVASVRDAAKATALAELGMGVRAGDFAEPGGLADAFAGATQVLVVSVDKLGGTALQMPRARCISSDRDCRSGSSACRGQPGELDHPRRPGGGRRDPARRGGPVGWRYTAADRA